MDGGGRARPRHHRVSLRNVQTGMDLPDAIFGVKSGN